MPIFPRSAINYETMLIEVPYESEDKTWRQVKIPFRVLSDGDTIAFGEVMADMEQMKKVSDFVKSSDWALHRRCKIINEMPSDRPYDRFIELWAVKFAYSKLAMWILNLKDAKSVDDFARLLAEAANDTSMLPYRVRFRRNYPAEVMAPAIEPDYPDPPKQDPPQSKVHKASSGDLVLELVEVAPLAAMKRGYIAAPQKHEVGIFCSRILDNIFSKSAKYAHPKTRALNY